MAYARTEWSEQVPITAGRLNNLENGVNEMRTNGARPLKVQVVIEDPADATEGDIWLITTVEEEAPVTNEPAPTI